MQSLSKSNFKVTQYQKADPEFGGFWQMLETEYQRSYEKLLWLSDQETLLSDNPSSKNSIALREEIVLPLIAIQQYALQQLRSNDLTEEQREQFKKMALRSMFGIINAARNAA
jgi:phosphoenolpyruvate carboxylase